MRAQLLLAFVAAATAGCDLVKVPLTDINAGFTLAEASWFEEEQTLFFFYRVDAEQGLGPDSLIEIRYRTDDVEQPWVELGTLPAVHPHLEVDCGRTSKCGSRSLKVEKLPREVQMRLRYHRDGELSLPSPLNLTTVLTGLPHTNRSAIVYGVFDEPNLRVQWRLRHQFPTVRNMEAEALGLRRPFIIRNAGYGEPLQLPPLPIPVADDNPYGYGPLGGCFPPATPLGWAEVTTQDRAIFDPNQLPVPSYAASALCAESEVQDAVGTFKANALARKNPRVAPAFPVLRSPISQNTQVSFFLRICNRTISPEHEAMQKQRLLLDGQPEICVDDWAQQDFALSLASQFQARIDAVRAAGTDMVLAFSLHHDDTTGGLAKVIETALETVLIPETSKSSPRVSGAFVFDSRAHTIQSAALGKLVLWCPHNLPGDDLDNIPVASVRSCPAIPDQPNIQLGPLSFSQLPILATRAQYLKFLEKYSDAQAGKTQSLTWLAPGRTPLSENLPYGPFGVATFFNNEVLTVAPTDAFSICQPSDGGTPAPVVFKAILPTDAGSFEEAVIPISFLPELQQVLPLPSYPLGVGWDAPYLLRLQYEVVVAGAVAAFAVSVPFGIANEAEALYGADVWERGEFDLRDYLWRCSAYCKHPTFDSAGVYNVRAPFAETYKAQCYRPRYPLPGEGGYPLDP